jgi:hypothetical protein
MRTNIGFNVIYYEDVMCTQAIQYSECSDEADEYRPVCSELKILCPRLVPSPLWGISLANIALMAPEAAEAICDGCGIVAKAVREYWQRTSRIDKCSVCNTFGVVDIDEDWRYCIYSGYNQTSASIHNTSSSPESIGIAYLKEVKPLCKQCHLAKHLGYSSVSGIYRDALSQLARVNRIDLDKAEALVEIAFKIHRRLSEIKNWIIRLGQLPGIGDEETARIETLLNEMYRKGFFIAGGWLCYRSWDEKALHRAMEETAEILLEAARFAGGSDLNSLKEELSRAIKSAMEYKGISVLENELRLFIDLLFEKWPRLFNLLTSNIDKEDLKVKMYLAEELLVGKWVIFVKPSICPQAFRTILDMLEEKGLAYSGKILSNSYSYTRRDEVPIIIYVPSALAPHIVFDVVKVVDAVRSVLGVSKPLIFKPDLFTLKGIYSKTGKYKPYIYIYRSGTTSL